MYIDDHPQDSPADRPAGKPYHAKRPHRKSRRGCRACKSRKVKCDEIRPSCRNCILRKEECTYLLPTPSSPNSTSLSTSTPSRSCSVSPPRNASNLPLVFQPTPRHAGASVLDMKLLWWYSTVSYASFASKLGIHTRAPEILQHEIPRHAFETPFLMDIVLSLAACHMQTLQSGEVSPTQVVAYRARAFEGYRRAIQQPAPGTETHAGLVAGSLLLIAIASQTFREVDPADLYILDWMIVWRGIGTVIDLLSDKDFRRTGLRDLFYRPAVDLEASSHHVPLSLVAIVASITSDDEDYAFLEDYKKTLPYIGCLYRELLSGTGPVLHLRTVTWFTFLPDGFIEAARARRPLALVIIAHYLAFLRFLNGLWWIRGIAEREIVGIVQCLGEEWAEALEVPCMAISAQNSADRMRILLGSTGRGDVFERRGKLLWVDADDEIVMPSEAELVEEGDQAAIVTWRSRAPI